MRYEAGRIKATRHDSEFYYQPNPFWWRHSGMVRRCDSLGRSEGDQYRELIAAGAEMSEVTFRMWIRYRSDVTSASRIIWKQKGHDAKAFDIQSAIPDEKATRLELLCKGGLKP